METSLPRGLKPLHLDRYDGTTDPDEHIDLYTTQVNLYTNSDAILCRVFPTSLKGAALHWYTQLPAESIDSFNTLIRRFTAQYATSRPHHTTSTTLENLKQNDDEPLRTFMKRFSSISVRIQNLNPEVALHSMLMALKAGPFVDTLCRDPPPRHGRAPRPRGGIHPDGGALHLPRPDSRESPSKIGTRA
uniref:Retrotransposon gag domain-containing protein n=1 Tax=Cajanus cajan TaxID=3821 RepID=A0A151SP67_CAJCA|nr:hypothetical protein KK1_002780 [Cajanus cajan]